MLEKTKNVFLDVFVVCFMLIPVVFGILTILSIIFGWYRLGMASILIIVLGLWVVLVQA